MTDLKLLPAMLRARAEEEFVGPIPEYARILMLDAIAYERERCAKLCEENHMFEIAKAIRLGEPITEAKP